MPRPKLHQPSYLHHKPTGQAYCRVPDGNGGRRTVYLGAFGSPASKTEHARILAALAVSPVVGITPIASGGSILTVNELIVAFLEFANRHYRRADGSPTNEIAQYRQTFGLLVGMYGDTVAGEFGPLALKSMRARMIEIRWSRRLINQRIGRIKRVFKWAVSEQLVPVAVHQSLATVQGLQQGRTAAKETDPVGPVADDVVDTTIVHLNRQARGLVEFQRLSGCRPGEACLLRRCDIDVSGPVWLFRPGQHKTAWRGKPRVIAIGPKAQSLLHKYFVPDDEAYLFSPRRATEEHHAGRTANRKTPKYPSHMKRNSGKRAQNPKRVPAERYTVSAYELAVARACAKAFPPPEPLRQQKGESRRAWWARLNKAQRDEVSAWQSAHRWSPNRLRHLFATKIRKQYGLEAAQVLLGHSRADVTQVYAARNTSLAVEVASKIG